MQLTDQLRTTENGNLSRRVALSAAAIGVIYGYDTGVVAGALLFIPKQLHLTTSETSFIATSLAFAGGIVFLDVARFLVGLTVGVTLVTTPVFIAESSPAKTRGSLLVSYQV